jgi:N-acetylneuraminate synthase
MKNIFIIAEAGVNHNGNSEMAFKLVDAAISTGASAIKFQTFKAENVISKNTPKAIYQMQTTSRSESQLEMVKKLELSYELHYKLMAYCNKKGINFLSTAFDNESLDFLKNDLKLQTFKIPSGEITNGPLLLLFGRTYCNLIVSTGMATLGEIEEALGIIAFGLLHTKNYSVQPSRTAFQQAYCSHEGRKLLKEKVTLLHCTTEYPAPLIDINLCAMETMRSAFGLKVGYSDHSQGIVIPIAAAALGATIIEKHFTLDNDLLGPDHKASLEPKEFRDMVQAIRSVEQGMGDSLKRPMPSEIGNKSIARKSLVALVEIKKDEIFTEKNIAIKRPGSGINPILYWEYLGKTAKKNYHPDELIV